MPHNTWLLGVATLGNLLMLEELQQWRDLNQIYTDLQ
jgi:hypothetical protein